MKKTIVLALATAGFAVSSFGQGSIAGLNSVGQYVTTPGVNATSPSTATTWYTGGLTLEVFFSTTATLQNINALNALDGTAGGGAAALAALPGFGFSAVSLTGGPSSSVGFVSGSANSGNTLAGFASTIDLSTQFASSVAGYYAFLFYGAGAYSTFSAVDAIAGNYGGQQVGPPLGTPFTVTTALNTLGASQNLVLTAPVPEPGTLALAAMGGASLLLFRRRK